MTGYHAEQANMIEKRERVYIIEQTVTQRYYFDPEQIKEAFGDMWDAYTRSFDNFLIELFEEYDGSVFHGRWFHHDASPDAGYKVIARWDDE